jgi:peptidoglycan/LPS O-acetylase OafA/YrhL
VITNRISVKDWYIAQQRRMKSYSQKVTDSLEVSKPKNHLLVLDGLRAIACLAVLSYHISMFVRIYHLWSPSGRMQTLLAIAANFGVSGVFLFFILSGFLLFLPFAKTLLFDGKWSSISRFYLRRFFRILPGYYAVLFLVILFFHPEFLRSEYRAQLWQLLTFRMSKALSDQVDGPFWTLAIEFQFYMLLPFITWIFALIVRRDGLRWRLIKLSFCLLAMLGWGLLTRYWSLVIPGTPVADFPQHILQVLKPYYYGDRGKYFECFAVGMLIAMIYSYTQHAPRGEHLRRVLQNWSSWIFLAGLLILAYIATWLYYYAIIGQSSPLFAFISPDVGFMNLMYETWSPVLYSICYGFCMIGLLYSAKRLKNPFESPVLRWIGLISFSLYMWHIPLLSLYMSNTLPLFQGWKYGIKLVSILAWVFFVVFPISLTCYRWVEMPGMRLGEALIQRVEKLKKRSSTDRTRDVPVQATLSTPSETAQEKGNDTEKTEPDLITVLAETPRR